MAFDLNKETQIELFAKRKARQAQGNAQVGTNLVSIGATATMKLTPVLKSDFRYGPAIGMPMPLGPPSGGQVQY